MKLKDVSEAGFAGLSDFRRQWQHAEPQDIWKARRFIEEHSCEQLSLRKVAKAVGIHPTHLSEKFKQVTGVKFVDYIALSRFEKARKLLENVDLRVSEIAFRVGFQSLSQFNRVFKTMAGKSPTEFRAGPSKIAKRRRAKKLRH